MKSKFKIKNIIAFDFHLYLRKVLIFSLIISALMLIYFVCFPVMKNFAAEKLNALPPELANFMSASGYLDLTSFNYYFAMIYNIFMIPLVIYSIITATHVFSDEHKNSTVEYLYSQRVSRQEMYISKFIVNIIYSFITYLIVYILSVICASIFSEGSISYISILVSVLFSFIISLLFISLVFFITSINKRKINPFSISLSIFIGLFFIGYLSTIIDDLSFLRYFSPMHMLSPTLVVDSKYMGIGSNSYNIVPVIIILILSFALYFAGYKLYNKKDLV